jgi:glycosyltransferase involved in cell wall biosynthesis
VSRPDVALISPYPVANGDGGRSGVASYSASLAHALASAGASVTVIAQDEDGVPPRSNDRGVAVERAFRHGATALPRAARAAIATGAPVVHLQHEFFLYGGPGSVPGLPLALSAVRAAGAGPVVTMHHAVDPAAVDSAFMRLHRVRAPAAVGRAGLGSVQSLIRRLAGRVIVHEPIFAGWIRGATVIPHGLPPAPGGAMPAPDARRALGLEERFTALCLGFVAPYKGLETALEAAGLVREEVQLVIAGGDHPRLVAASDPYADRLRAHWSGVARFLGYVPDADLPSLFAAADVALFPYPTVFSASGALALAVAHDRPVLLSPPLAGATGAPPELAVPLDPSELAARLRRLARSREELDSLATASAGLKRDRSWAEVSRAHLRIYEEVSNAVGASGRFLRAA